MKIVCDACQAKYSIADEKIQGKAFKIRCKKCNHIIVVKPSGEVAASAGADKLRAAAPAAAAPAAAAAGEPGVWHVVVNGEQVGPITEAEVREKLHQNQINAETLVWKEGFADWTALSSVPELAALQSKPARASASRAAVAEPSRPAAKSLFPTTSPSPDGDVFGAPTVVTPAGTADLFAAAAPAAQAVPSSVGPSPSSPFLFGGAPAQPSEPVITIKNPGNGAGGAHLTGQRNENSVLFSLSNLEALAVPSQSGSGGIRPPSSTSNTEGSGLIDIRSMAAMTLNDGSATEGRRSSEGLPSFSTPQFSPVAPVLLPISNSGPPKWVYPVLGLLAVGILILGYGVYRVMAAPPPGTPIIIQQTLPPPPPAPAVAPPPAAPTAAPAPEAAKPSPAEQKAEATEEKAAEKSSEKSKGSKGGHHKGESSKSESSKGEGKGEGRKGESSASSDKGKFGKGSKELDSLLGDVGKKNEESSKPAAPQVKLITLTQSDIVTAMKGVQPKVQNCANQFKVPGTALANISVASGGRVSNATVTGKFAGTPTGSCVEVAAKSAKFPPCQGMNFPWPFTLSPR